MFHRVSNDWQTKIKPFFQRNESVMRKKIARMNLTEFNTTNLTAYYKSRNAIINPEGKRPVFNDPFFLAQFYMVNFHIFVPLPDRYSNFYNKQMSIQISS